MKVIAPRLPETDEAMWTAMQDGCHDAYTLLIKRYFQSLYSYGIRLENDSDLVKDCIQTMFHDIWKSREKLSHAVSVKAYLFSSLRRLIGRQRRQWVRFESLEDDYTFQAEISIETRLIDDQILVEQKARIQKILNSLPARQREILYLRFYENLDHAKICEVMQINQQVVYNLLHKSLLRFRRDWAALSFLFAIIQLQKNF